AWIYLRDESGTTVASVERTPANYATVNGTVVLDTPLVVASYHICSWWNSAYLRDINFFGDSGACLP
ncbi:MAG: hypothetical protein CVU65_13510, partial [Deltaproteobacteria bacterium HGW-Deltaproteobacteria-22]